MNTDRIQLLQKMPLFSGVSEDALAVLLGHAPVISMKKEQYFFHENGVSCNMYVLEEGRVAVIKSWDTFDYLLRYLNQGACFGEMALLDQAPRSASVVAVEDCKAIEISQASLQAVSLKDPDQFSLIQKNMGREVSRRLRETLDLWFSEKVKSEDVERDFYFTSVT